MELSVLGPVRAFEDEQEIDIGGPRAQSVLGLLIAHRGEALSADRLAFELWGDDLPETWRSTLRSYVSRLRKALGASRVTSEAGGYRLTVQDEDVDASVFEAMATGPASASTLRSALGLWHGRAFEGVDGIPSLAIEARRLEELRLVALERRFDLELEDGAGQALVPELEALVEIHPLREKFRIDLALALYRDARQAESLRTLSQFRQFLGEELGLDPSQEITQLEDRILQQDPGLLAVTTTREPHGFPHEMTSFVGREDQITRVQEAISNIRVVTLIGPGGTGKTRLAARASLDLGDSFPDGLYFVPLAHVTDPAVVSDRVAEGLGLASAGHGDRSMTAVIIDVFATSKALVVLDNCEQILDAAAELVAEVSRACPHLHVLATSREALSIPGEQVLPIPPLRMPAVIGSPDDRATEAIELFAQRALAVQPGFDLDASIGDVERVCRRLDGLPLAIEMAAAQMSVLSPADIAGRLDEHFGLLAGAQRGVDPRHATLHAAIQWSYDLLGSHERALLRRLSVFSGGWTVESAAEIVGGAGLPVEEIPALLIGLVAKSLVIARPGAEQSRYDLLETVRAFSKLKLAEANETSRYAGRHALWFADMARPAEAALRGHDQQKWFALLNAEHDNLRAAFARFMEVGDHRWAAQLTADLGWFWTMDSHWRQSLRWVSAVLGQDLDPRLSAEVVLRAGSLQVIRVNVAAFRELLKQVDDNVIDRDSALGGWLDFYRAMVAVYESDEDRALGLLGSSLMTFERIGDPWAVARVREARGETSRGPGDLPSTDEEIAYAEMIRLGDLRMAGWMGWTQGTAVGLIDPEEGRRRLKRIQELCRETGNTIMEVHCLQGLAMIDSLTENFDRSEETFEEALVGHKRLGDDNCVASCLSYLSEIHARVGLHAKGLAEGASAARRYSELGNRIRTALGLGRLAENLLLSGRPEEAIRIYRAASRVLPNQGLGPLLERDVNRRQAIFAELPDQGDVPDLSLEEAVAMATRLERETVG